VGGSTLFLFPRPDVRVREVTYDPANLGILTCVTIGQRIAVYIPYKEGDLNGEGLEVKLREWYSKTRAPTLDSGKESQAKKLTPSAGYERSFYQTAS
jgi:hypothetical protein